MTKPQKQWLFQTETAIATYSHCLLLTLWARQPISQSRIPRWDQMAQYASFALKPIDHIKTWRYETWAWSLVLESPSVYGKWRGGTLHEFLSPWSSQGLGKLYKEQGTCPWYTSRCLELGKFLGKNHWRTASKDKVKFLFQEGLLASDEWVP
jgi:hypothetical protein